MPTGSKYTTIELQVTGPVVRLTLDRASKLNALDETMLEELLDALAVLDADPDTSVLVVTGRGRAFSAGVDVSSPFFLPPSRDDDAYAGVRSLDAQHRLISALHQLPQLTIAAINGDAIGGGGFGLAMACDMRVAVRAARFWMVPGMLDVIQDFGLSWLLQRRIGSSRTLAMAALGDPVSAEEGERWGFLDTVVEDAAALDEHLAALEGRLRDVGVDALRMLKLMVRAGATTTLDEQLGLEAVANGLNTHAARFARKRQAYVDGLRARRG